MGKNKRRVKKKKPRNWHALNARFRSSAGSMGDKRKEESRDECRKWKKQKGSDE